MAVLKGLRQTCHKCWFERRCLLPGGVLKYSHLWWPYSWFMGFEYPLKFGVQFSLFIFLQQSPVMMAWDVAVRSSRCCTLRKFVFFKFSDFGLPFGHFAWLLKLQILTIYAISLPLTQAGQNEGQSSVPPFPVILKDDFGIHYSNSPGPLAQFVRRKIKPR